MKTKNKKNKSKVIIVGKLLYILLLGLIITLMMKVISMDVLPMKYLILVILFLVVFLLIIGFFIFKKGIKFFIKVFNIFLVIVGIFITCFALIKIGETVNFLNGIKNKLYQEEEYYIITLKESTYTKISDIDKKEVATYKDEINGNYNNGVIDLLNEHSILIYEYDDYLKAAEALINKKVEILYISANYKSIVEDEIKDFNEKTKIIHKITVKIKAADIVKEVDVSTKPFNVFISGIDTYGKIETTSRSDVNMVVTVNPDTKKVLLTSIPRDYYVQLNGTTGYKDKITHAGMYGIEKSVKTVEDLLNIDINYYVRLNFTTLKKLVDAIGGIEINSPKAFTSKIKSSCKYKKGLNKVNGTCALYFVRERYAFEDGDKQRVKNQQEVIRAIVDKAMKSKTIVSKYSKILNSFGGNLETNMSQDKIYDLVKLQLATMPSWDVVSQSLDGYDSYEYTYSMPSAELYVMIPDEQNVEKAKKQIKKIFNAISESTATGKK